MRLKRYIFFLTISNLLMSTLSGQTYDVSGVVKDAQGAPIALANVWVNLASDSTFVKGTATDEKGEFIISNLKDNRYILTTSYIGNTSIPFQIKVDNNMRVGNLVIPENVQVLDEVEVAFQKPSVEQKIDRLVFNVENTALTDSDVWDLLGKTPGVMVLGDKIAIKGNNGVGILINGRKINLPESDIGNLLSGTSASNVESIEVITNPPAKYSAESGMLINIVMKKNLIAGYNGAVFNRYRQGVYAKHSMGTDHFFKGNKSDLSINYTFGRDKNIQRHNDIVNFSETTNTFSTWTSQQDYLRRIERHGLNLFYDYQISQKRHLSLATINSWNPNNSRMFDTETTVMGDSNVDFSDFNTMNNSGENTLNTSYYVDYVQALKKSDEELSVNLHYTYYEYDRTQRLSSEFFDFNGNFLSGNDFSTDSNNQIDLYSARLDYSSPVGIMKLETGFRYAGITSESTNEQEGFDIDQPGIDPIEVGKFNYEESIYAAYVGLAGEKNKWEYKGGLRAEYTNTLGVFDSGMQDVKNDYFKLFPSFSIQYTKNSDQNFRLGYYRRIIRPRFVIANPFQYFQTNNSVYLGNPNILPSTRHYIAAAYTFAKGYTFDIFYRNQKNPIRQLVLQDNQAQALFFQQANFHDNIAYGFDFTLNKSYTNFWSTYAYLSILDRTFRFIDGSTKSIIKNRRWAWSLQLNNNFTLLQDKSLFADVRFNFKSKEVIANIVQDSWSNLSISMRKSLWDKKASISLGVEDIFNQRSTLGVRKYSDQDNISDYRFESRLLTLGFRYRFGNTKIRDNKKSRNLEERRRL